MIRNSQEKTIHHFAKPVSAFRKAPKEIWFVIPNRNPLFAVDEAPHFFQQPRCLKIFPWKRQTRSLIQHD
jgi:hypothetical protein